MKYLKYFEQASAYEAYKNGSDFITPNISYIEETKGVSYEPKKSFMLRAKYNATPDNLVAFTGASNVKALKVNGTPITIEPIKNENNTFDVLGENISLDVDTGEASFPDSYLIKSPVTSWSFKAKDPNYVINENTYACMLGMMDGMTIAEPMPLAEAMGYAFTTNDGVTLELGNEFLAEMNMQIQSGSMQVGFTLMDVDMNSGTLAFIDTEHQTNVTTGGLPTYSFDSEGSYDVEIELADSNKMGINFDGTPLISIEIPDSVTSIEDYTFYDCSSLTSVTIGSGVTSIGVDAFENCSELTSIVVSAGNTVYDSRENCNCLIETATNRLIKGSNNSFIPNGVTTIGYAAFHFCFSLTSITIPDSVTTIEYNAFMACKSLESVTIGNGVTEIRNYVFYNCSSLTSVIIGDSVTSIGEQAFGYCSSLNEIICKGNIAPQIQNNTFGTSYSPIKKFGVLKFPDNADYSSWMSTDSYYLGYYGWTSPNTPVYDLICTYNVDYTSNSTKLFYASADFKPIIMIINGEKLEASSSYNFNEIGQYEVIYRFLTPITEIKERTFYDCTKLTSITIPDSVTSIGKEAFRYCSGLTGKLVIPDSVTSIGELAFNGCMGLTGELVIPSGVTIIEYSAFGGCSGLTGELVIPNSVTTISKSAFSGCSGLTSITIPDSVTSISDYAFNGCSGLTSITIPDSVTSIGTQAFRDCSGLTGELVIPDSVTSIGTLSFGSCSGLTSVTIGSGVTTIGSSAFSGCSGLTGELVIPDSVQTIGDYAFRGCAGLTEVTIGSGVTSIGNYAFRDCTGLISITCLAPTAPSIKSSTFRDIKQGGILYAPTGSDYSSWMSTSSYYLGMYNWTIQYI